eukprot:6177886-Pleurochrysis_carterae.AAC.2
MKEVAGAMSGKQKAFPSSVIVLPNPLPARSPYHGSDDGSFSSVWKSMRVSIQRRPSSCSRGCFGSGCAGGLAHLDDQHRLNECGRGCRGGERAVPLAPEHLLAQRLHRVGLERELARQHRVDQDAEAPNVRVRAVVLLRHRGSKC